VEPDALRAVARWPGVPAVFGWLALDRRGDWLLREPSGERFSRVGHAGMRAFIGRHYGVDEQGRWFVQNGPQRVFVNLAYTPFVLHYRGTQLFDQCGAPVTPSETWVDEEGSVLMRVARGLGLLDDRDLDAFSSRLSGDWTALPRVRGSELEDRFGFVSWPSDSLR